MLTNTRKTESVAISGVTTLAWELQFRQIPIVPSLDRKAKGQFFTPPSIARYMAGLACLGHSRIRILDPGAGTGILSAALCERILKCRKPRRIEIHLFENDPAIVASLRECMSACQTALQNAGHQLFYTIHEADFVLAAAGRSGQTHLFTPRNALLDFDIVIMNPPYFKISKESTYATLMRHVVYGQPNVYSLFLALGAELLAPGGELIAITPRSFCNGPYFRAFRRWFLEHMALRHIHLFESRKDTFPGADVLQESVITLSQRLQRPVKQVSITTSFGASLAPNLRKSTLEASQVIDKSTNDWIVHIPENPLDANVLDFVGNWHSCFLEHGLRVSTGPVVSFRARRFLEPSEKGPGTVPLISVHNVQPYRTIWPLSKNGKPKSFRYCEESRRLLLPLRNYVLVRRFSSKEEQRRLVASYTLKGDFTTDSIAIENHLNYIYHAQRELTVQEVYGLVSLFNSALMDRYFRCMSGNTQVNANEIRLMRLPDLQTLAKIGRRVRSPASFGARKTEQVVLQELGIKGILRKYLEEHSR